MIKLDDNLLQELNLGILSPEEKKKMLAHIYETLEMRVGMELAKQMTDAQLNEFEEFINRNDEAGALRWLETNFPNYKDVVAAEFDRLKAEIRQVAPQIIASSQQQAQAQQQAQSMAGADPMMPPQRPQYPPQMPPQGYQSSQSRDDYDLAA
jgi:predicted RNA-binding Zn ribbon-like protein